MDKTEAKDAVESLQNLLIARATGGGGNEADYHELRDALRSEDGLRDHEPPRLKRER